MPRNAVLVDVVENGQAGLVGAINVEFSVVRLPDLLVASLGPWIEGPAFGDLVGWRHLLPVRRPEPAVKNFGFKVAAILAALEVAETSGCPNVGNIILLNESEDHIVLVLTFYRHEVHAVFPADVSSIQPIHPLISVSWDVPAVEVIAASVVEFLWPVRTLLRYGQGEESSWSIARRPNFVYLLGARERRE